MTELMDRMKAERVEKRGEGRGGSEGREEEEGGGVGGGGGKKRKRKRVTAKNDLIEEID